VIDTQHNILEVGDEPDQNKRYNINIVVKAECNENVSMIKWFLFYSE
jgi:hypothetical protein